MALERGMYTLKGTVSTDTDTAIAVPADARPTVGETVHVLYAGINVTTAGTSSQAKFQDGASGKILACFDTTKANVHDEALFMTGLRQYPGAALTPGNTLNLNSSGGATFDYIVIIEVK